MHKYGIYLISDPCYNIEQVENALKTGQIKYLQYRNKTASDQQFVTEGIKYKLLCEKYHVKLIVNDRIQLAGIINADGIHVGQDDAGVSVCKQLYPNLLVGVSVSTLQEAKQAVINGADYIGVGAMFATATKPNAKLVTLDTLIEIHNNCQIDIVTIGGITVENARQLIQYSDGLAICSNILAAESPAEVVSQYSSLLAT